MAHLNGEPEGTSYTPFPDLKAYLNQIAKSMLDLKDGKNHQRQEQHLLREKLSHVKEDLDKMVEMVENQMEQLSVSDAVSNHDEAVKEIANRCDALQESNDRISDILDTHQSRIARLVERLEAVEQAAATHTWTEYGLKNLQRDLDTANERIRALEAQLEPPATLADWAPPPTGNDGWGLKTNPAGEARGWGIQTESAGGDSDWDLPTESTGEVSGWHLPNDPAAEVGAWGYGWK